MIEDTSYFDEPDEGVDIRWVRVSRKKFYDFFEGYKGMLMTSQGIDSFLRFRDKKNRIKPMRIDLESKKYFIKAGFQHTKF